MKVNEAKTILGITQVVISTEDLKKIFKKEMLQWHPDIAVHRGISIEEATLKSQNILLAHEILSKNLDSLEKSTYQYDFNTYHHHKTSSSKNYKQYYDYSIDSIDENFINRITLNSSNVKWIDYIRDLAVLVVRFKNRSVYYLYFDVPENVYEQFQRTDSPGRFVYQYLHRYKYESHNKYAEWLNVYKSISDISNEH
jgi:hypothetical protein